MIIFKINKNLNERLSIPWLMKYERDIRIDNLCDGICGQTKLPILLEYVQCIMISYDLLFVSNYTPKSEYKSGKDYQDISIIFSLLSLLGKFNTF